MDVVSLLLAAGCPESAPGGHLASQERQWREGLGGLLELLGLETVFRRPPRFWPRTSAPPSQRRTRCHFRRLCSPCPSRCTRFPGCTRRQILASVDKPCPLPRRRPPRRSWARLGAAGP